MKATSEAAMQSPESFRCRAGVALPAPGGVLSLELRPYAVVRIDEQD